MRIAIPVFGKRISPRFDCAPGLGLFEVERGEVTNSREISCEGWGDIDRVSKLRDLNVDTLICGGLPEYLQSILRQRGIQVIPWIAGNADEALSLFLKDRLVQGMVMCSVKTKRFRCRRGRKAHE